MISLQQLSDSDLTHEPDTPRITGYPKDKKTKYPRLTMKTDRFIKSSILFLILIIPFALSAKRESINSPNGKITLNVNDENGHLSMSIYDSGKELLSPSPIGLVFDAGSSYKSEIKKSKIKKNIREMIEAPFHHTPKYETIYNELLLELKGNIQIEFRVYDDGVAYRYLTKNKKESIINDEIFELNLPGDPIVYLSHSTNPEKPFAMAFQNFYKPTPISSASPLPAFLPATVDYNDGLKMTILESDLESYPGMFLQADSVSSKLKGVFAKYPKSFDYYPWRVQKFVTSTEDYIAKTKGEKTFPWRIFAITEIDTQMPVNNLVYSLASPSRMDDISWIRPGKAAWEWWNDWGLRNVPFKAGINNETYKYFIDFAADNGLDYVVLDEGWYDPKSGDMLTTIPEIDLPMLSEYAREKGVGLWLWTVFNVLDSQLEEACRKYSEMGISGFKVDFLDRNDQEAVEMTYRIADATAKHNLMLDLHGFYTPTGLNRTYPNIVNYESVFGMEEMKWSDPSVDMPEYDVTFPFIRMMAGPVDFTPGAMLNRSKSDWKAVYSTPMSQGTRTHQIAHYIVHDTPFSMLADSPSNYLENKDCLDFIASIPSEWDMTDVIDGVMGEYIVTLRKKDDVWFIGGQTDWNDRDYELDFSFLPGGSKFKVTIVIDGKNADRQAQDHEWETFTADSGSKKSIHMAPGGGFAVRIDPL